MIIKRLLLSLVLLALIFFAPYWIYLPVLFLGIVFLPFYWEAVIFAFLVDTVYGPWNLSGFPYFPIALAAAALLLALPYIKRRLRFNA
jgi:hypothetical protein